MPRVRRSNPLGLPPRVYAKSGGFYYVTHANKWVRLGKEWNLEARVKWAELAGENTPAGSIAELLSLYREKVLPTKARRTQVDQLLQLERLNVVFGRMAVDDLKLRHAAKYLELRGEKAPVRANREIALLSHVYRWAMNKGLTALESNPCEGVMYHKETPGTRLVTDDELERFLAFARGYSPMVAAVTRLMYVSAQRRADLLTLRLSAAREDGIELTQSKTGAKLLIEWSDELRDAYNYARSVRSKNFTGLYLICTRDGQPYTDAGIKSMFARTMKAATETKWGPPVLLERFKMQHLRPKAVSDVGGGKRAKDLAGHRTQATTDRVYDRVTFKKVKPTR